MAGPASVGPTGKVPGGRAAELQQRVVAATHDGYRRARREATGQRGTDALDQLLVAFVGSPDGPTPLLSPLGFEAPSVLLEERAVGAVGDEPADVALSIWAVVR